MNTLGNIISIVSIIVGTLGIVAVVVPLWRSRQRYGLRWAHLPPRSMLDIAEERIAANIAIYYKESRISNLTQYQFILHNIGYTPLKNSAIVKPFEWVAPGPIVSFRVVDTGPPVILSLKITQENRLQITWELFNQRCKALIEVLCESNPSESEGEVDGQIENVPQIEEKQVYYVDDDERIRQIQKNRRNQGALERLIPSITNRGLLRVTRWIMYPYLVFAVIWFVVTVLTELGAQQIVVAIACSAIVILAGSLFLAFRNPYATFIRRVKAKDAHPPQRPADGELRQA